MKILPIVLSNRQTSFKNTQKQSANNTANQNTTTNSIYDNSKTSLATRNLAFGGLNNTATKKQLAYIKKLEKALEKNRLPELAVNTLNSKIKEAKELEVQLAIIDLFEKYPDIANQSYCPPIIESIENFKSPKAQQAIIGLFEKYPELMQVEDTYNSSALHLAAINFKTTENQLALIELFRKYPELATMRDKFNKATPPANSSRKFRYTRGSERYYKII